MSASLRIAIADDEPDMRDYFQDMLPRLGHSVVAVAADGQELVEKCRAVQPDLVITDVKMPKLDGIDAAAQIQLERPVPVILVSAYHDAALVERAELDSVMAYLVKPIKKSDLGPTLAIAVARFAQFQALQREADDLRQALSDRKVIERAKGIIMKQAKLDEAGAFRRLQKLASEKNHKLVEMASMIVTAEQAFLPE